MIKERPYWHVDAKWICGILFTILLWITFNLYTLATLTSKDIAVPVATEIVAGRFSPNGLDDPVDIAKLKEDAAKTPSEELHPLPNTTITKTDLEELTPRQIRLKIFEQIVRPYYELGPEGVAEKQTVDATQQEKIKRQAGVLAYFNLQTHNKLQNLVWIFAVASLLPLAGLVFFSHQLGRLVSPALVMSVVAFPGTFASGLALIASKSTSEGAKSNGPIPFLPQEAAGKITLALMPGFAIIFGLGILLLLAALIGKIIRSRKKL